VWHPCPGSGGQGPGLPETEMRTLYNGCIEGLCYFPSRDDVGENEMYDVVYLERSSIV
jgi:hypothetical protein